ncbi:EamA family transporter [Halalkalicoccus salilacus]|uniref:EamA family transporter n=1 Tax=Halalkalicoccus salilacus TaxID=3117459 RepID=UPI0038D3E1DD
MDMGLAVAVLAAFVWGCYLFALKRYFPAYSASVIIAVVHPIAIGLYLPIAIGSMPAAGPSPLRLLLDGGVGIAVIVVSNSLAFMAFIRAITVGEISYVAPISKIVPAFVLPLELLLLGEHLTPLQLVGVALATVAVYVANFQGGAWLAPLRRAAHSRAAQFALLSAALYAVGDVGRRVTLQELAVPPQLLVVALLGGMTIVLAPQAARTWPGGVREDLPKFLVAGAVVAAGEHTTMIAFSTLPASIASPIINTQAIVAVVLGGLVLREEAFGLRLLAAALAVCGVTLIAI